MLAYDVCPLDNLSVQRNFDFVSACYIIHVHVILQAFGSATSVSSGEARL